MKVWVLKEWNTSVQTGVVCLVQGHMAIHREHGNKYPGLHDTGQIIRSVRMIPFYGIG